MRAMVDAMAGHDLYEEFAASSSPRAASMALLEAGIPGIRYADAGSRGYSVQGFYDGKAANAPRTFATEEEAERVAQEYRDSGLDAEVKKGDTHNYVIFDDSAVEITAKYQAIDTPAFRRWFGDSKVVDENGEPLVLYHGGTRLIGPARVPFFMTAERDGAEWFSQDRGDGAGEITPVHASIQNPFMLDAAEDVRAFVRLAREAGAEIDATLDETTDGWEFHSPTIAEHSDNEGTNPLDLVYVPAVREALERAGYDGVAGYDTLENTDIRVFVALRPEQVRPVGGDAEARFQMIGDGASRAEGRMTPEDRALVERHLAPASGGRASRLLSAEFRQDIDQNGLGDALVTQIVNALNPIFSYEKRASGGTIRDASVSAAKMAEFAMNDTGRTWSMAHVGPLRYDENEGVPLSVEGGKGLFDIFKYLSDPDTYDRFRLYAAARRGERLMAEGRERNLTPEAIERGLELADERGTHTGETRRFRQIFDDYQEFNKALLEGMGVATGLLSQEEVDLFTEHMDYVPFYREIEEGETPSGPWLRKMINRPDPQIRALEGGEQRVADLMDNVVRNAMAITRAGMRNVTMQRIFDLAETLGEGRIVSEGSADEGVLTYRVRGREVKFTVDDPALVTAVAAMKPEQLTAIHRAAASITSFFRNGIVSMPAFMLRNLVRGTTAGFVQTGQNLRLRTLHKNNPIAGLVRSLRSDRSIRELKAISGTGAYTFGGPTADIGAKLRRKAGASREAMPIATVKAVWEGLEYVGEATELADRDSIYRNLLDQGATKAEAAYQAMNLINYSRKGAARSLRTFLPVIPFLNARIQGLYRMAETQKSGAERRKALTGIAVRGLILTAISMLLREATKDDDRYDDEPMHRKLNYYIVYSGDTRILIPKAFEFGAVFSTVPELIVDAVEQDEGARLAEGLTHTALNTFAFNPVPQPVLPLLENIANYNAFTGREIESLRLRNLRPSERFNSSTPHTLRAAGRAANLSPVMMENLVRGYTGTMGMSLLAGIDAIGRAAGAFPSEPTGPFGSLPIFSEAMRDQFGSMYREGPDRSSRWVGDFYEMARDINQTYRHVKSLREAGDVAAAAREYDASRGEMDSRKFVNRKARALSGINREIRSIEASDLSPLDKRRELNRLYRLRNEIAETTVKSVKAAAP